MGSVIHQYGLTLIAIWEKAFGKKHVMSLSGVKLKLKKIIKKYYNQVYNKAHRKTKKKRKADEIKTQEESRESIRSLNKQWRLSSNNNNLFDIGKEMEKLVGREKEFFIDQLTTRECCISEEIDEEYVREQQIIYEDIAEQQRVQQAEVEFIMDDDEIIDLQVDYADVNEYLNSTMNVPAASNHLNVSTNRSRHVRVQQIGLDASVQTDAAVHCRPILRVKLRSSTDEIKATCAKLSSICGLSVEKTRTVVQIVCKELYNHDIYLSPTEQLAGDGVAPEEHTQGHLPVSSSDYENYTYVIPSARTIADYKQIQASEMETMAARALYMKKPNIKAFVHFDTTSRSSIDGE